MRDFIDFIKYVIKDRNEKVYKQYICDQEVHRHRYGGNPPSGHTFLIADL